MNQRTPVKQKTMRFLGLRLHHEHHPGSEGWQTPGTDPFPHASIGVDIGGKWFCILSLQRGHSIVAQFKPSKRAAVDAVRKRAKALKAELGRLDI